MIALFEKLFYEWPAVLIDLFSGLWLVIGVKPVVLGSDLLVYALILGGSAWFTMAMRREYWRTAFRQVSVDRLAVFCFGILCVYGSVGLLDTMHYREVTAENENGGAITSVLDRICRPLINQVETTYSAPLATQSFSKTNTFDAEGNSVRDFKPLKYGGAHLENPSGRDSDVLYGFLGAMLGGLLFGGIVFGIGSYLKSQMESSGDKKQRGLSMTVILAGFFGVLAFLALVPILLSEKYHIFGTDKAGADVFYMSIKSVRTGLVIGTLTTLIVTPFAILMGVMAGYFGGWVDDVIQYIYTTLGSIPSILLIAAAMLIFQIGLKNEETIISADKRLVYLCIIMGITSWSGLCRLLRAEVMKIKEIEYIQAADAFGVSRMLIIVRHLVPNVMHIILINIILRFSGLVLTESVLTYIGIGVDPSMSSWGNMINQARMELARDPVVWWSLPAAFIFMFGLVLPANLFGDAVRDALDPRLRTR